MEFGAGGKDWDREAEGRLELGRQEDWDWVGVLGRTGTG